jgi:hypothetical protein
MYPLLLTVIMHGEVNRAAIVPHYHVAGLPAVPIAERRLRGMRGEQRDDRAALRFGETL